MGTIADKLAFLGQTKAEIRDALLSKGVDVSAEATFREYAGKIREITAGDGAENPPEWQRPADWLPIEDRIKPEEEKFVGLYAIFKDSNFIALSATSDYIVDWGDGAIEHFDSGTQASHQYSYKAIEKTETAGGYKQVVVTVTPQKGQDLKYINLQEKYDQADLNKYSTGWLDIRVSGKNMERFSLSGTVVLHGFLESFCFMGDSLITDFSSFFSGCYALQSVALEGTSNGVAFNQMFAGCSVLQTVPLFDTSGGTDFSGMFSYCYELQSVALLNTAKGTDFSNMFQNCIALKKAPLLDTSSGATFYSMFGSCFSLETVPPLNTSKGTDFGYMFATCLKLKTIPLLDTANGLSFNGMFGSCLFLKEVPLLDTAMGKDFQAMFGSCASLKTIPLLNTKNGNSFGNMFSGCSSLRTIPLLNTETGMNFYNMFYLCGVLESVPPLNVSNATELGYMFVGCETLSGAALSGTRESISYAGCKLSSKAIVAVFNRLGSDVKEKTISIGANWGASLLSSDERAIATKKGWIILG